MNLKILKVGGSVITHKNIFSELNLMHINHIIGDIARWLGQKPENRLIFIAGAGSFGHIIAHEHGVNNPTADNKQGYVGFLRVAINMQKMGNSIAGIFEKSGIQLFPISTSSTFITDKGRIIDCHIQIIERALASGLTPLLWGDSVFDDTHRARILSGDQIATYLFSHLEASELLFGTNVDGVYQNDPFLNPEAQRVPQITEENYQEVMNVLSQSNSIDVTQGMEGKIAEIYSVKKRPVKSIIFDARKPSNVYRALSGDNLGTSIIFE